MVAGAAAVSTGVAINRQELQALNGGATTTYGGAATVATAEHGVFAAWCFVTTGISACLRARGRGRAGRHGWPASAGGLGTSAALRVADAHRRGERKKRTWDLNQRRGGKEEDNAEDPMVARG